MISTNYFILTKNIGNKFYTYNLEIGFVEIQEPFRQTVLKTRVLLRYLSNFFSSRRITKDHCYQDKLVNRDF